MILVRAGIDRYPSGFCRRCLVVDDRRAVPMLTVQINSRL
jgi:hypothetical protein